MSAAEWFMVAVGLVIGAFIFDAWLGYQLRRVSKELQDRQFDLYLRERINRELGPNIVVAEIKIGRKKRRKA